MVDNTIAAFQITNKIRKFMNLSKLALQQCLCIIMLESYPIFYLVNITQQLVNHVENGTIPNKMTLITKFQISIKSMKIQTFYNRNTMKLLK
ncbi:unnamed protein product [Cunninghamella blakesleeana]